VALLALCSAGWPTLLVNLIACVLSPARGFFGETARGAEGMRGGVTGGVLSPQQVGALVLPLVYSGLLDYRRLRRRLLRV
jgi:hypothetical protein